MDPATLELGTISDQSDVASTGLAHHVTASPPPPTAPLASLTADCDEDGAAPSTTRSPLVNERDHSRCGSTPLVATGPRHRRRAQRQSEPPLVPAIQRMERGKEREDRGAERMSALGVRCDRAEWARGRRLSDLRSESRFDHRAHRSQWIGERGGCNSRPQRTRGEWSESLEEGRSGGAMEQTQIDGSQTRFGMLTNTTKRACL